MLSIYGFYNDMYAHYPPRGAVLRSSAAQTVDGDLTLWPWSRTFKFYHTV